MKLRVWKTTGISFSGPWRTTGPASTRNLLGAFSNKFYRAPDAPTGGTGLGLSLVKGFVEALGGNVSAANLPGGGMEFTVTLPLKPRRWPPACLDLTTLVKCF